MMFSPSPAICDSTCAFAPLPMLTMAMTAPTPMMMPSAVSADRILFRRKRAERDLEGRAEPEASGEVAASHTATSRASLAVILSSSAVALSRFRTGTSLFTRPSFITMLRRA